jgi:hypothetical protein
MFITNKKLRVYKTTPTVHTQETGIFRELTKTDPLRKTGKETKLQHKQLPQMNTAFVHS